MSKPTLAGVMKQLPALNIERIGPLATHLSVDENGDVFTWTSKPEFMRVGSINAWLASADRYLGKVGRPKDASACVWELKK